MGFNPAQNEVIPKSCRNFWVHNYRNGVLTRSRLFRRNFENMEFRLTGDLVGIVNKSHRPREYLAGCPVPINGMPLFTKDFNLSGFEKEADRFFCFILNVGNRDGNLEEKPCKGGIIEHTGSVSQV